MDLLETGLKADTVLVKVNLGQTDEIRIGDNVLRTGRRYNWNFREKNPSVAEVVKAMYGSKLKKGDFIICNYSYFEWNSPYHLEDDYYAIPVNEEIFAWVDEEGWLHPLNGNILAENVDKEEILDVPDDLIQQRIDRGYVIESTDGFRNGDLVLWLPYSNYEICYFWNGEERRVIKVHQSEIFAVIKK